MGVSMCVCERESRGPAFFLFTSPSMALHVRLPLRLQDSHARRLPRLIRPRKGAASSLSNPLPKHSFATHLVAPGGPGRCRCRCRAGRAGLGGVMDGCERVSRVRESCGPAFFQFISPSMALLA